MSSLRFTFAPLLLVLALGLVAGCKESDEQRIKRLEAAMDNAKVLQQQAIRDVRPQDALTQAPLTAEEKAANDPNKKLILFCAGNLGDPFQQTQSMMMRSAVQLLDGYRYKVFDAMGDISKQAELMHSAENERPVWLIVQPLDDRLIGSLIEALHAQGTHIISLDQRIPDHSCDRVVFTDQRKLGRLAGEVVVQALRRKAKADNLPSVSGRVLQIRGLEGAFESRERAEGFAEVLRAEPGIVLVHDAAGDWNADSATRITEAAIRLQHEFDVVFAHNDSMAEAASLAMLKAQIREQALIVGIDGVNAFGGGLDLLRRGIIDATIWQPMPMETVFAHLLTSSKEPKTPTVPRVECEPIAITPKTLDAFTQQRGK